MSIGKFLYELVGSMPAGFEVVKTVVFKADEVTIVAASGQRVTVPVQHEFLKSGKLPWAVPLVP